MKLLFRLVFNRWVMGAIGLFAVALLIWWVGPTVAISNVRPFESETVRWIQIAVVVMIPVLRKCWTIIKARKASAILAGGLLQQVRGKGRETADPSSGEVAQLGQRFESALALLRKQHFGTAKPSLWARLGAQGSRQYLYDLPWYVFIGAPGAGKTTALLKSGLRFPLAERLGRGAVRGVGGTRNCDWWFTDEAVFLDTAGRYTTQQSDQEVDAAAWKGFLQLLKKTRPRRPINGVLVTVSVADLLQHSPAEAEDHAEALRARVQELYADLGVRLPIYILVSKSDLLAGFSEYFADLGKDERAQVWGFSLPFGDQGVDPAALTTELERLERRLWDGVPERLEEERDPTRRALMYGFPQQFALLRDRLVRLVDAAFAPSRFEAGTLVRGIYFTSGTQEGSPIDRVMGALSRELGLERKLLPAQQATGRSYFLTRLLREVVFPEAGLAGTDLRWERRRRWIERGAVGAAVAALILITVAWWISYVNNRAYIAAVGARFEEVKKQVAAIRGGGRTDLAAVLPTLTNLRTLAEPGTTPNGSVPLAWRAGLYQGGKLQAATRAAYHRMLQDTFLPSLVTHLERFLDEGASGDVGESYDALKAYVMLFDPKHFQRDSVWRWYESSGTERQLVGAAPGEKTGVKVHFDALYDRGWVEPAVGRNEPLVVRVRTAVSRDPLPKRVYQRLKRERLPDVRDFTIAEKAGPNAAMVFERPSGELITRGVPAFFTKDGYHRHFAGRVEQATLQLAEEETWVLGRSTGTLAGVAASPAHADAVRRLYLEDYRRIWQQFNADVTVVRDRDLARTIEITKVLSGADSPLKLLMKAIDREVSLSVSPDLESGLTGAVAGRAQEYVGRARKALGAAPTGALEKGMVDDHFEDVHRFAAGPGGAAPPPTDVMVQQLNDFYTMLVAARAAIDAGQPPPSSEPANKLRADVQRHPDPARTVLNELVDGGMRQVVDRTVRLVRTKVDGELRGQIVEFCLKATADRYPFTRTSNQDVTPEDFARLFAPGALLDGFFQKQLAQYVDVSRKPWRFKEPAMGESALLAEFQRAEVIRDVFFRGGGSLPAIQLELKPVEMDESIQQFLLDVDGKLVRYAHGPQVPVRVQFPGPGGRSQVRVSIAPPPPSGSSGIKFEGPWALFRMFDGVQIRETGQSERFLATINVEGRRTVFEVVASSVRNPFRLPELSEFRCPAAL
jgi:type VI secretion system protein ImpL